ncbi:hypothetical protein DY000_02030264 [Brassica cretica]|uniref:Uncharacterized protein n=1 Tax=Brassica cretica TaxID=69181 RepID=A0ABQ7DU51_BRACR|nr:hypothetical protein DY000_02030264 [Brassica cretica]
MAMKPNGKSPVSSNNDEILMFFKDISLAPHETQLRYLLIHFWEAPELFGQSKNQCGAMHYWEAKNIAKIGLELL